MKTTLTFTLLFFITFFTLAQQAFELTGVVQEADSNEPLPGVVLLIKGTSRGTRSDFDGQFKLAVRLQDTLVVSYVGFETLEHVVESANPVTFHMKVGAALEEVVVTGYAVGSRPRKVRIRGASSVTSGFSLRSKTSGVSIDKVDDIHHVEQQSGQLTAGEVNDLKKWKAWQKEARSRLAKSIASRWEFELSEPLTIEVKDAAGAPLINCGVSWVHQGRVIARAQTNVYGEVTLFAQKPSFHKPVGMIQVYHQGQILGKPIPEQAAIMKFAFDDVLNSPESAVDIQFTVDATGSMGDEMDYLKAELKNIISRLDTTLTQKRVGFTFYRDLSDAYVTRSQDFTANIEKAQQFLNAQHADGGGDYEEAVEEALRVSMEQSWNPKARARLLFLMLDAPPHWNDANVDEIKKQIRRAQEKGIRVIPVVASGADKTVEFLMRFFSVTTNGTYVFLTDDSGIGNPHLKPSASDYTIEKLNDLIVRLISEFAGANQTSNALVSR
ncbi:carboxypeptidase-like regulatory domain-containing protein [Croceiramulus getboli]|nr:carboxypeptidase-like regulatory domain-containing protein [Flavobacteriaceae bacterium YJPT1-3]